MAEPTSAGEPHPPDALGPPDASHLPDESEPPDVSEPLDEPVAVIADPDAVAAGRAVRAHLDAGTRAAGFVGAPDDPALAEFVADVARPRP